MEIGTEADLRLREMSPDDLATAHALSRQAQWPHRLEDWELMLSLGQGVVAELNGEIAGTVMAWRYEPAAASLGMVIVSETCRGRGLGRKLMDAMTERLNGRTIMLNATDEALSLYRRLGFETTGAIFQHQGAAFSVPVISLQPGERVRPLGNADLEAVVALDRAATGLERRALITALMATPQQGVVLDRGGEAGGFALFRRFGHGYAVGPVVAPDLQGAKALISHWLGSQAGMFVRLDVPGHSDVAAWLAELGLPMVGRVTSMVRGAQPKGSGAVTRYGLVSQAFG